jgi:hypothetical protein
MQNRPLVAIGGDLDGEFAFRRCCPKHSLQIPAACRHEIYIQSLPEPRVRVPIFNRRRHSKD